MQVPLDAAQENQSLLSIVTDHRAGLGEGIANHGRGQRVVIVGRVCAVEQECEAAVEGVELVVAGFRKLG